MFSVHRSSYQYWRHRSKVPSAEQIRLRALVREAHESSRGSAGARTIADIVSNTKQVPLTRYRANKLMKLLGLVSCQTPNHRYKKSDSRARCNTKSSRASICGHEAKPSLVG